MSKVFITRRIPDVGYELLRKAGLEFEVYSHDTPIPREKLLETLAAESYTALLTTLSERVDAELLDAAGDDLKIVANFAVGYNNVDVPACTARGVAVSNTPGVLSEATADQAMMLMLAVARRVLEGHALAASGEWAGWAPLQLLGQDLGGKTLGIVGMGRIGREVAKRAQAFNMTVRYHNRSRDSEAEKRLGVQFESDLYALLAASDIVTLHCPLTDETRHLINKKAFETMKPNAILVNTARGEIVNEQALVEALTAGRIWGAGLDVFEFEPRVTDALKGLPNVVLAPHLGSATQNTRNAMATLCAEAVVSVLKGERVPHILNSEVVG